MNRIFGHKKEQPKVEEPNLNMDDLYKHSDRINTKVENLYKQLDDIEAQIKGFQIQLSTAKGYQYESIRSRIMTLLQKKRNLKQQLSTYGNINNCIDNTVATVEQMDAQKAQLDIMKQAVGVMSKNFTGLHDDEFYDIQDQMSELRDKQQEINEVLSQNYTYDNMDMDIESEMADIEKEVSMGAYTDAPQANMSFGAPVANSQSQYSNPVAQANPFQSNL
ncbi:hypothetical protein WA158_004044 [Blastocystis sp. Blastoise]